MGLSFDIEKRKIFKPKIPKKHFETLTIDSEILDSKEKTNEFDNKVRNMMHRGIPVVTVAESEEDYCRIMNQRKEEEKRMNYVYIAKK